MAELPKAKVIVLRKAKRMAPDFHRHIAKSQARGQALTAGDTLLIYQVVETVPPGPVEVSDATEFEFV